jgi:hypothetical protein
MGSSYCYIVDMSSRVRRLLIFVLALLVAFGPVGGAIAGPHPCTPDADQSVLPDGMPHSDHHGHHQSAVQADVEAPLTSSCDSCDTGCCLGSQCSMGHCAGTAAAFQSFAALEFERYAVSATVLSFDRPLAGRLTPPFRPPQI